MENQAYDELARVEDTHWYHESRRRLLEYYLDSVKDALPSCAQILDVGCGTGGMLNVLEKYGDITGLEISEYALSLLLKKHPSAKIKIGSANDLDNIFKGQAFDLATFFNVLYHKWIADDVQVLKKAADIVKPGGFIVLNEPAYGFLYRDNDKICFGARRYTKTGIRDILTKAGFRIVKITYFNSLSFLPLVAITALQRSGLIRFKSASNELRRPHRVVNELLKFIMSCELAIIKIFGSMPFGVSVFVLAEKVS